jgi:hypothetical protein
MTTQSLSVGRTHPFGSSGAGCPVSRSSERIVGGGALGIATTNDSKSLSPFAISKYTLSRIKRQDFGPRQPAYSGKVVAAKSGMWLIQASKRAKKSATYVTSLTRDAVHFQHRSRRCLFM